MNRSASNLVDDTYTIEGIRYSAELFRQLGRLIPLNEPFVIVSREDGVLVIQRYEVTNLVGK